MGVRDLLLLVENKDTDSAAGCSLLSAVTDGDCKLLVIDGSALVRFLWDRTFSVFESSFGGNYMSFTEALRAVLDTFMITCKVPQIAVFMEGAPEEISKAGFEDEYRALIQRTCGRPGTIMHQSSSTWTMNCALSPALGEYVAFYIFDRYVEKYSGHVSFFQCEGECDTAIEKYATAHDAFGVLSDDDDYLIRNVPYIPLKSLQLPFMKRFSAGGVPTPKNGFPFRKDVGVTLRRFLPGVAAQALSLPVDKLPLFACLVGCDYLRDKEDKAATEVVVQRCKVITDNGYALGAVAEFLQNKSDSELTCAALARFFFSTSVHDENFRERFAARLQRAVDMYTSDTLQEQSRVHPSVTFALMKQHVLICPPLFQQGPAELFAFESLKSVRHVVYALWDVSSLGPKSMPETVTEYIQNPQGFEVRQAGAGPKDTLWRPIYESIKEDSHQKRIESLSRYDVLLLALQVNQKDPKRFHAIRSSHVLSELIHKDQRPLVRSAKLCLLMSAVLQLLSVEELMAVAVFLSYTAQVPERQSEATAAAKQWSNEHCQLLNKRHFTTTSCVQAVIWHLCFANSALNRPLKQGPEALASNLNLPLLASIMVQRGQGCRWTDIDLSCTNSRELVLDGITWLTTMTQELKTSCQCNVTLSDSDIETRAKQAEKGRRMQREAEKGRRQPTGRAIQPMDTRTSVPMAPNAQAGSSQRG